MNFDDLPWVTAVLTTWMIGLYLFDPTLYTGAEYFFLSPWTHSGFNHFWNNMAFFLPLGVYVERRVGSLPFLVFAALIPYLSLQLPVVWSLGGFSQGASGLTKALTGYALLALLVGFSGRLDGFADPDIEWQKMVLAIAVLLVIAFLALNSWITVQRFAGFEPSPAGVSVASHFFGLIFGVLWFGWRGWRYGVFSEP